MERTEADMPLYNPRAAANLAGYTSVAKDNTQLDRLFSALKEQDALLQTMSNRLSPVSESSPTEAEFETDHYQHISAAANKVEMNNQRINTLLRELVI